jgi:hypothetical protein
MMASLRRSRADLPTLAVAEPLQNRHMNGVSDPANIPPRPRIQRLTIALPTTLLERLRNAVYWRGSQPLAHLITEALERAASHLEQRNGGRFPIRLAPLKRGRPRQRHSRQLSPEPPVQARFAGSGSPAP